MSTALIPDAEYVLHGYLAASAELEAVGLKNRVLGSHPTDQKAKPWVRYQQLDATGAARSRADHLIEYLVQFDCYASETGVDGSPRKEATLIARTLRAVLHAMPGVRGDAVVTSVRFAGMVRLPDHEAFEPARERVILTAQIWMHP